MEARTVALCVVLNSENFEVTRRLRHALSEWSDIGLLAVISVPSLRHS